MYIIYAKQHFGACWSRKSLTQRKYLLILFELSLATVFPALRLAHQLLTNPFILFNKFLVKLTQVR